MERRKLFQNLLIGTTGGIISGIFITVLTELGPQIPKLAFLIAFLVCGLFFELAFIIIALIMSLVKK